MTNDQNQLTFAAPEDATDVAVERKGNQTRARTAGAYTKQVPSTAFYPSEEVALAPQQAHP